MITYTYFDSPIGRLLLHSDGVALTGLYMDVAGRPQQASASWTEDAGVGPLPQTVCQLDEYFMGRRRDFDLPLRLEGTGFQQRVWQVLTEIPYGVTWSYGELARRIGNPNASRAVGLANGRNGCIKVARCIERMTQSSNGIGFECAERRGAHCAGVAGA